MLTHILALLLGALSTRLLDYRRHRTVTDALADSRNALHERDGQISELNAGLRGARAEADARRETAEQRDRQLQDTHRLVKETVRAAAADALGASAGQLAQIAAARLDAAGSHVAGTLSAERAEVGALVAPVRESLRAVEVRLRQMEAQRQGAEAALGAQIRGLADAQTQLMAGTRSLVGALRRPAVRGRFGEVSLQVLLEQTAGLIRGVHYAEQPTLSSEDGALRPDFVLELPGDRRVVLDSKCPMDAWLDAWQSTEPQERAAHLERHAKQLLGHIRTLDGKQYWANLPDGVDWVVLYLPHEGLLEAAMRVDGGQLADALRQRRVVVATPLTLLAMLRVVAQAVQASTLAENAREIETVGRELHERVGRMAERLSVLGRRLGSTVQAYNDAAGSYESRVVPGARRLAALGASKPGVEIDAIEPVRRTVRDVSVGELATARACAPSSSSRGERGAGRPGG